MIQTVVKRDGRIVGLKKKKIMAPAIMRKKLRQQSARQCSIPTRVKTAPSLSK